MYGFHRNAEIATNQNDSENMIRNLCSIQPQTKAAGGSKSPESIMEDMSNKLLSQIPEQWDLENFEQKFPTIYEESMNTVLNQESVK